MTHVPIMPLNVEELFADPKVKRMGSGEVQAFWEWFLTKMWSNHGWLPVDDRLLSRLLEIDVRRWRGFYRPKFEPLLLREVSPILGDIYRQRHLTDVWDGVVERIAQNKKRTAPARAKKASKTAQQPSGTEKVTDVVTKPVTEPVTTPVAEPVTNSNQNQDIEKTSALQAERSSPNSTFQGTALPPREPAKPNGPVEITADHSSPGLEGGSSFQPSEALLKSKIVSGSAKPKDTSLAGLIAAIERGKEDDEP